MTDNDFGFTAVDDPAQVAVNEDSSKALALYKLIIPLLNNLEKDSDKDYIHWPNRKKAIAEFRSKINKVLNT